MLTTEFNGIQYVFEEDRLYLNGTPLLYSDMSNIAHRGGDQPAFIFDYKGRRFALPYNPTELQSILPYFKYAQNYTAPPAPEIYEPVAEPAYDPTPVEPAYDPAPEVYEPVVDPAYDPAPEAYEPVAEPYYQEDAPVQEVFAQEVYDQEVYEPVTEPAPEVFTQEVYAEEVYEPVAEPAQEIYEPEFVSVPEPEIYESVVESAPVSYEQETAPVTGPYYQEEVPAPDAYPQEVYEQDIYEQETTRAPETYEEIPVTDPEIPEDAPAPEDLESEFIPVQEDLESEFIPTPEDLEAELAPSPEDLEPAPSLTSDLEPEQPPKKGLSKKIIIIGAVILAALIGAAIFFFAGGSDEAAPEDVSDADFATEEEYDEYYEEEEDVAPTGGDFEATDGFSVSDADGSMDIKLSKVYIGDDALQKVTDLGEDQKEFTDSAEDGYKLVLYEYEVNVKDGSMIGDTVTGEMYTSDKKTEFDDWWPVDLLNNMDKDLSSGEIEIPAGETANVYIAYYMPEDLKDYYEIVLTNEDGTEIWVHYVLDK